ncbi:MAG: hypothetical protein FWE17_00385 [Alphaproteobacteria bacterium]|nr:hypothetical protein [Alphaproteobacteria bacterium]MCL2758509.1 hypothetical protein [Alphaproteobacteria bacterium]
MKSKKQKTAAVHSDYVIINGNFFGSRQTLNGHDVCTGSLDWFALAKLKIESTPKFTTKYGAEYELVELHVATTNESCGYYREIKGPKYDANGKNVMFRAVIRKGTKGKKLSSAWVFFRDYQSTKEASQSGPVSVAGNLYHSLNVRRGLVAAMPNIEQTKQKA